jgi:predicted ATP-dependent endonuclease of OLD family
MRISKITVNDFRAFPHVATFDLTDGANLLVYGENGSGKSSLFQALREFFRAGKQPPPAYSQFKNIFIAPATAPPAPGNGRVSLELMETTGSPVKRTVT